MTAKMNPLQVPMSGLRTTLTVFALAATTLWVSSYFLVFNITTPVAGSADFLAVTAMAGRFSLSINTGSPLGNPGWSTSVTSIRSVYDFIQEKISFGINMPMPGHYPPFEWKNVSMTHPTLGWTWKWISLTIPLWLPVIVFGLWPLASLVIFIRKRYFNPHCCRSCGYDLRGSVSSTCSECGAETAPNHQLPVTGSFRKAIYFALAIQIPLVLLVLIILDSGFFATTFGCSMVVFWIGVAVVATRCRHTPNPFDHVFIRWGFFPLLALIIVIGAIMRDLFFLISPA